jgi:hypothetical protein
VDDDQEATLKAFKGAVNMTPKGLEGWLETADSQKVGQKDGGGESTGHAMGREIVTLLGKKQVDYTDGDIEQMQRVVSYVHRHLAQKPKGDLEDTNWRYSLMNWGHDPLK